MKKISTIFLILFGMIVLFNTSFRASAQEELQDEYGQVVNYISSHLSEFKTEYNQGRTTELLNATSIEKHCIVYIIDSNEYGVYLDFNDDKGYLVTSLDYTLYTLNTTEDLPYLKNVDFAYYSVIDGFLYHNGTSFQKFQEKQSRSAEILYGYNGQGESGEGDIYDIDEYIADRYPSYKLEETQEKACVETDYVATRLGKLSYYIKYISYDGGYHYTERQTENNCALVAAYNALKTWQPNHYTSLPSTSAITNMVYLINQDPDYQYYGVGEETVGHDFYWAVNDSSILSKIPTLFYRLRLYAVELGYEPIMGFSTENTRISMQNTLNYYGYNKTLNKSTNFSDVITTLQDGRGVFMGIANSQTYPGNHAVALLGYKKYSYKTGVWIFQQTHIAYFYLIDDAKTITEIYFDPNCNSKVYYEFIY